MKDNITTEEDEELESLNKTIEEDSNVNYETIEKNKIKSIISDERNKFRSTHCSNQS